MKTPESYIFGGLEVEPIGFDEADIIVLPICYENAPSYGTGSREGALHILEASGQLEGIDEETLVKWAEFHIHTRPPLFPPDEPEKAVIAIRDAAHDVIESKKFLLSLGGDHAITIGPVMAACAIHPDIGILQIDAHLDFRNVWNGSKYNHACVMRRIVEDLNLPVAQVGIRSVSSEELNFVRLRNLKPVYAREIDPYDFSWIDRILDTLPEKIYLTLDVDGLDPSVIPGTGTPEPGGLTYRQVLHLIRKVGQSKKVIAADINELAKIEGSQVSEFTAAKIASKILFHCR